MAATKHTPTKSFAGHHPSPSYHSDLFVVRVAIHINGLPTEVRGNDNFTSLNSPDPHYQAVPITAVTERVSTVLTSSEDFNVVVSKSYCDQNSPILSVDFPPNKILENVQALLSRVQALAHSLRMQIEPLFTGQDHIVSTPTAEFSIKLELYRCCTKEPCQISEVTMSDAKYHVDMYENSVVFEFPTLMEQRSSYKGVDVKFNDLVKELNKAVDEWFNIGVHLQVPLHILLAIRKKQGSDMDHLTDMLIWLVENTLVSWNKVVCALCTVNKRCLARSISQTYGCLFPSEEDQPEKDEELEHKKKLLLAERARSEEVRHNIHQLTDSEYPELKRKIHALTKMKEELNEKLECERAAFNAMMKYRDQSIRQEKEREETDSDIAALKDSMGDLQEKLKCSELEYKNTTARMKALMDSLSRKSCELEAKSSELTELEESLLKMDRESQAAQRQSEDQKSRDFARSCSQTEYVQKIQTQIESEEKTIFDNKQEVQRIDQFLQATETELSAASERLKEVKSSVLEAGQLLGGESLNLETIEKQIEVTTFNIEVADMRSEYALKNFKKKSLQVETEHRLLSLKLKKNLLPCLAKCTTHGIAIPVHKTQVSRPVKFTVTLYDEDGLVCTGDHVVAAKMKHTFSFPREEPIMATPEGNGLYTLKYTPNTHGECTVEIFINDIQFSESKLFVTNSPYLPRCTMSGDGLTTASKNKVSTFQVFLVDKDGSPVNSEQTITAHLKPPPYGSNCLVLPAHVTKWEVRDVYSVSYMPNVSGPCELTVFVNGEPLAKSIEVIVENTNLSPLAGAALHGELEFVKLLLGHSEDRTNIDRALNEASRNGHIDTIKHLIKSGANVKALNKHKRTPLFLAAWHGHADAVELLATEGADVNAKDKRLRSALMLAAWHGHELTVRALIKHGAKVNSKDELGDSPLHDAARNGHVTIIKTLLAGGAIVDTRNMLGDSPLHYAARNGHVSVIETLLASGAIVDDRNMSDQTPLMTAASNGHSSAVQVLVENKADPNIRDTHLRSPLLFAVENHHSSTVITLIECGANVDAKYHSDNTALHIASCEPRMKKSEKQKLQTLNVLIEKGADINIQNKDLQSPLLIAACYGCVETVHTLVRGGADINIKDWLSRTAIDCARELEHKEVYEYLQSVHQTTV